MGDAEPIAVDILTGFLGAGKTTLLNRLLKDPALSDTAVIINEFGEISIDHLLVEQASDGVVELGNGCVCCTVRGDLVDRLADLAGRAQRLRRVIVETTGLADPVPIVQAVLADPVLSQAYRLSNIVTVVDAANGPATLEMQEEARRQVAVADRLVLTKADLVSQSECENLIGRLKTLTPDADILDVLSQEVNAASFLAGGPFRRELPAESVHVHSHCHGEADHHDHAHAADGFQSVSLTHDGALPWSAVENFLDLVTTQHGEAILRIKGLVAVEAHPEQPVLIQGAQKILHKPETLSSWPDNVRGTRIIVIGRALDVDYVRRIFSAFAGRAAVDAPDRKALEENPLAISGFRP